MLAFSSNHTGNFELYTASVSGVGGWSQLTDSMGVDRSPVWTIDDRIIFISQRDGGWGLYALDMNSSAVTPLFPGQREIQTLALSPDGSHLAFAMIDGQNNWDIYTLGADGTDLRRLTTNAAEESYE